MTDPLSNQPTNPQNLERTILEGSGALVVLGVALTQFVATCSALFTGSDSAFGTDVEFVDRLVGLQYVAQFELVALLAVAAGIIVYSRSRSEASVISTATLGFASVCFGYMLIGLFFQLIGSFRDEFPFTGDSNKFLEFLQTLASGAVVIGAGSAVCWIAYGLIKKVK